MKANSPLSQELYETPRIHHFAQPYSIRRTKSILVTGLQMRGHLTFVSWSVATSHCSEDHDFMPLR